MKSIFTFLSILILSINLTAQNINTICGNGFATHSGDGGQATLAAIGNPFGVAVDAQGNIYVSDVTNNRIRKITTTGIISTFAGTGVAGFSGDNGQAISAKISSPAAIVFDKNNNLIFCDRNNHCIRKITPAGIITTIIGNGTAGFSGDGGQANLAKCSSPLGLSLDTSGNIYFADNGNHRIRKISTTGIISTIAGTGTNSFSGDGGQANLSTLSFPSGATYNEFTGEIIIADRGNVRLRKISKTGIITTICGNGTSGATGNGGPAVNATLYYPSKVIIHEGNILIPDAFNNCIRFINNQNNIFNMVGTIGTSGFSGDGSSASIAKLNITTAICINKGNLYVCDYGNSRVRKVSYPNVVDYYPKTASLGSYFVIKGTNMLNATGTQIAGSSGSIISKLDTIVSSFVNSSVSGGLSLNSGAYEIPLGNFNVYVDSLSELDLPFYDTGYFYHPVLSRPMGLGKNVHKVNKNTYEFLAADLNGSIRGQFSIDANNNLYNWLTTASSNYISNNVCNFLNTDNPGGFTYTNAPNSPGTFPFAHSNFNNSFSPTDKSFNLHFGYQIGATNVNQYQRQIYSRLLAAPIISNFYPKYGSCSNSTNMVITGKNLLNTVSLKIGSKIIQNFNAVNDSTLTAVIDSSVAGSITVKLSNGAINTSDKTQGNFISKSSKKTIGFIPNKNSNSISVIDFANNSLIKTLAVGAQPVSVSVSPEGTRAIVTCNQSKNVYVINTETIEVIDSINIYYNETPTGCILLQNGLGYVVGSKLNQLFEIDIINKQFTILATLDSGCSSIAHNPLTNFLYITNSISKSVHVFSINQYDKYKLFKLNATPTNIAFSYDYKKFYVTLNDASGGKVAVINAQTNDIENYISVGLNPNSISLSKDGSYLYVANIISNNVSKIDTKTNTVIQIISVGTAPNGVCVEEDGNYLYVINSGSNSVSVINTQTNQVISTVSGFFNYPNSINNFICDKTLASCSPEINVFKGTACPNRFVSIFGQNFFNIQSISVNGKLVNPKNILYEASNLVYLKIDSTTETGKVTITTNAGTVTSVDSIFICPIIISSPKRACKNDSIFIFGNNLNTTATLIAGIDTVKKFTIIDNTKIAFKNDLPFTGLITVITKYGSVKSKDTLTTGLSLASNILSSNSNCIGSTLSSSAIVSVRFFDWYCNDTFLNRQQVNPYPIIGKTGYIDALNTRDFLATPQGIFVDKKGNTYIAEQYHDRVTKWAPNATKGILVAGGNGNGNANNQLKNPIGVYVDSNETVYVADSRNDRIMVWAKNATQGYNLTGGTVSLLNPKFVAADDSGNIYMSSQGARTITKWSTKTNTSSIVPGAYLGGSTFSDYPIFVKNNFLYVGYDDRVRKINLTTYQDNKVAGGFGLGSAVDQLNQPNALFVDDAGLIYVFDKNNNRVSRWRENYQSSEILISGLAGNSNNVIGGDCYGLYVDADSNIYVSDVMNQRIQKYPSTKGKTFIAPKLGTYYCKAISDYDCSLSSNKIIISNPENSSKPIVSITNTEPCGYNGVLFTANTQNINSLVSYKWKRNGFYVGKNMNTFYDSMYKKEDSVWCEVTFNDTCVYNKTIASNKLFLKDILPTLTIASRDSVMLLGDTLGINLNIKNPSNKYSIYWYVNDVLVDSNKTNFIYKPKDLSAGNRIYAKIINKSCGNSLTIAASNELLISVVVTGNLAFVGEQFRDSYTIINTDNDSIMGKVRLKPYDYLSNHFDLLGFSPDGKQAYFSNWADTFYVLSTQTFRIIKKIAFPNSFINGSIAYKKSTNTIYISATLKIFVIDAINFNHIATINNNNEAGLDLLLSPDEKFLYLTSCVCGSPGNKFFLKINTNTNTIVTSVGVSPNSYPPYTTNKSGSKIYTFDNTYSSLKVLDTSTLLPTQSVLIGGISKYIATSPDSSTIFITQPNYNRIIKFDINNNVVLNNISVAANPKNINITSSGNRAYVLCSGDTTVSVLDLQTNSITKKIALPAVPVNGLYFINKTPNISKTGDITIQGQIKTPLNKNIPNVVINNSQTVFTNTSNTGFYALKNLSNKSLSIKPTKNNDIVKANGINSADIILTQRHITNALKLNNAYKLIAADVTGDKQVNSQDILRMKRLVLGSDTTFRNTVTNENRLWVFVDSAYVFPDTTNPYAFKDSISFSNLTSNKINQSFIGVRLGDVNWDWNAAVAKQSTVDSRPSIELLVNSKNENGIFNNQFSIINNQQLSAIQSTIHFDNSKYEFVNLTGFNNLSGFEFNATKANETGNISILWVDKNGEAKEFNKGEELFTLMLRPLSTVDSRPLSVDLALNNSITESFALNKNLDKNKIVLKQYIGQQSTVDCQLLTIYPNPSKGYVTIQSNGCKEISVIDYLGRIVKMQTFKSPSFGGVGEALNIQLTKGVYIVKAIMKDGSEKNEKLIVE